MNALDELQRQWLAALGAMLGTGAPAQAPTPAAAPEAAGLDTARADVQVAATPAHAAHSHLSPGAKSSHGSPFVPELMVVGGRRHELALGGNVTVELRVRNWAHRPKGTRLTWGFGSSGDALEFEFENLGGEGFLKVSGQALGKGLVKAEVQVEGGRLAHFPPLAFMVSASATQPAAWVPRLEFPHTVSNELALGEKVGLKLVVANWDERPGRIQLDWTASSGDEAIAIDLQAQDGQATVTVTALKVGHAKVHAHVKVRGGGDYAFRDTPFTVIVDNDPNRSVDQGGPADSTNLEQDMRNVLQDWHAAAHAGINQFIAAELSKRIDKLESGSGANFLAALLGNVVWAAACFTPLRGAAFAISLVGIAIGAVPAIPSDSESFIPAVQKAMGDHIDGIFDQLDTSLRNRARLLVERFPGITRFHAMNEFVATSFQAPYIHLNAKHTTIPTLAKNAIRDQYQMLATQKLDEAIRADEADKAAKKAATDWEKTLRDSRRRPGEV